MAYLLWRLQIHQRYLSRLVDDFPDQLLFCIIIATRRARSVRLTASEMVNMNILREAKWNNLGQKSSATVDVAPPMISEKHSNMFCFPMFFPQLWKLPRGFCRMFFEVSPGLQLAVSLAGCLGVPCGRAGHGSSPCGELHFAGRTSETWSKNGILVGLKLFWRPKCRNFRNKYEYWMICLYIIHSIYSI